MKHFAIGNPNLQLQPTPLFEKIVPGIPGLFSVPKEPRTVNAQLGRSRMARSAAFGEHRQHVERRLVADHVAVLRPGGAGLGQRIHAAAPLHEHADNNWTRSRYDTNINSIAGPGWSREPGLGTQAGQPRLRGAAFVYLARPGSIPGRVVSADGAALEEASNHALRSVWLL